MGGQRMIQDFIFSLVIAVAMLVMYLDLFFWRAG
jgi:hypothetical protein